MFPSDWSKTFNSFGFIAIVVLTMAILTSAEFSASPKHDDWLNEPGPVSTHAGMPYGHFTSHRDNRVGGGIGAIPAGGGHRHWSAASNPE